jgi:hypothetical protein
VRSLAATVVSFEEALRKRVLPTFRRGAAANALEGDLADLPRAGAGEPGVRERP